MAPPPSPWKPEQCSVVAEEMKCLVHICRIIQIMKAPVPWNCFLCSLRHRSCFIGLFLLHGKGLSSMGSTPVPVYLNLLLIRFRALNSGFSRSREVWFDTCSAFSLSYSDDISFSGGIFFTEESRASVFLFADISAAFDLSFGFFQQL